MFRDEAEIHWRQEKVIPLSGDEPPEIALLDPATGELWREYRPYKEPRSPVRYHREDLSPGSLEDLLKSALSSASREDWSGAGAYVSRSYPAEEVLMVLRHLENEAPRPALAVFLRAYVASDYDSAVAEFIRVFKIYDQHSIKGSAPGSSRAGYEAACAEIDRMRADLSDLQPFRRILVTGSPGAGKTAVTKQIAERLNLFSHNLGSIVQFNSLRKLQPEERDRLVDGLTRTPEWVIDGVSPRVLAAADVVIFLDIPRWLCLWRAVRRSWRYLFRPRPGIPLGVPEILVLPRLYRIIRNFPRLVRPAILAGGEKIGTDRFFHVKSKADLAAVLAHLDRVAMKEGKTPATDGSQRAFPALTIRRRVRKGLERIGWVKQENIEAEQEFRALLGSAWLPCAGPLVRVIGHLYLGGGIVSAIAARHGLAFRQRVEGVIGLPCCPLGGCNYLSCEDCLWIDSLGRFYAQDEEGMIFLAADSRELLEILILRQKRKPPPESLREALAKAYRWDQAPA